MSEIQTMDEAAEFPTATTIPFPYDSPYDVQRELMAAILDALKQCREQEEEDARCDGINTSGSHNFGTSTMNSLLCKKQKRKAKIIMLESPTGTGKSLSLACASMAWLRHCETADLRALTAVPSEETLMDGVVSNSSPVTTSMGSEPSEIKTVSPSHSPIDKTATSSTSYIDGNPKPNSNKYDWLDSWQPSSNNQPSNNVISASTSSSSSTTPPPTSTQSRTPQITQNLSKEEQIQKLALDSRSALDSELNNIRTRLDRLLNIDDIAQKSGSKGTHNREKERSLRENLVRSGVSSALARERKIYRHRARVSGGLNSNGKDGDALSVKNKRRKIDSRLIESKGEDEFLVDDYHSEEDVKGGISSDSDDESIGNGGVDSMTGDRDSKSNKTKSQKAKSGSSALVSAKDLLNGGRLDGSGYSNPNKSGKGPKSYSSLQGSYLSDQTETTVGGVEPGSGVRKIIYAARTHSQLSQFISELRRTHWGKDVKVVALGSRSLLCGNDNVLYSNNDLKHGRKNRRSEAEITEMCLDLQKGKIMDGTDAGGGQSEEGGGDGSVQINVVGNKRNLTKAQPTSSTKNKKNQTSTCPYLASPEATSTLAMHMLVRPSDIEDLASLGRASHACSYYASREALAAAEVVVLPYNTLLSPQARQSVGLSIKNSLIVIDEAHNIPETLRNISSCQLSLPVAEAALTQLLSYTRRYSGRLAGRNLFYLGQIRRVLLAMIKYLKRPPSTNGAQSAKSADSNGRDGNDDALTNGSDKKKLMMSSTELMFTLKLDNVNLFSLIKYLEKSRLSQKMLGFVNHVSKSEAKNEDAVNNGVGNVEGKPEIMSKHVSSLSFVETFLIRLTSSEREGKIIAEWPLDSVSTQPSPQHETSTVAQSALFRFVRIHSASQLDNVIEDAHAIILAGGTLRPFSHVAAELFGDDVGVMKAASDAETQLARKYDMAVNCTETDSRNPLKPSHPSSFSHSSLRLSTFTCGHVIPSSNVVTACLSFGPTSKKLDFRHTSRASNEMIDELGRSILNLCNIVPSGFVIFLPSYNYESQVFQRWRSTGIYSQIDRKKRIHREPKNSRDVETALAKYSKEATSSKTGALLFSVMGGKMSEGINFANDMARCVLVVGLPYPDITDPILQEKMRSLDASFRDNGTGITGQAYYHNLCMRTVNQSVGRAIRHANDYAAIVLADFRYASDHRIWHGLPQWLRKGCGLPVQGDATFGRVLKRVRLFFAER